MNDLQELAEKNNRLLDQIIDDLREATQNLAKANDNMRNAINKAEFRRFYKEEYGSDD